MKLKQVEKCWLIALYSDGYRYLARDGETNELWAYKQKPDKDGESDIWSVLSGECLCINHKLFARIKNTDDVPFAITCDFIPLDAIGIERCEE
ncbi:MAG: hypothetical protein IJY61_03875 [Candidatus Gastranaerophilales bacterium]|nr:hypothetical protein [Alphaproteobacteria bacterium]MBQ8886819.1 hypothetical protein [Candidatus Gastranaerophilales bacterium]